jgi:predicted MPP superfamily phosphohydrolase
MGSILALLLAATWFAAWTFAHFEHLTGIGWILVPLLLAGGFVPTTILSRRLLSRPLSLLNLVSGISIGFLNFFILAALACWATDGLARLLEVRPAEEIIASGLYGAAALISLFSLFSAHWLRLTRVTVPLPNLPPFWNGRTMALVTDIHLGNFRGAAFSRRVVSRLMSLGAECILIGGDMFDGVKIDVRSAVEPWKMLSAPSGVFFVGGNHDDYGGRNMYFGALRGVGMRVLDNEKVTLHGLQLVGVHDAEMHEAEAYRAILAKAAITRSTSSVLLAHRPSNLAVPEELGINLQLSGHTHSGQFWPWTHAAIRVHGKFTYGLHRFRQMLVYTSSGAGTWGPPFRLGTRSECVLITLVAADSRAAWPL